MTQTIENAVEMAFGHYGKATDSCYNSDRMWTAFSSEAEFQAEQNRVYDESGHARNLIRGTYQEMLGRVGRSRAIDICNAAKPESERNNYELFINGESQGVFALHEDADQWGGYHTLSYGEYCVKATRAVVTRTDTLLGD